MADFDMMKEIPGYKAILKSVLKSQIQLLIEQLSEHAGEESIILTASVNDGSLSHLGSSTGKGFFEGRDEIKSQFLGYCLKTFHKEKTREPPKPYQRKHPSPRTSPSTHANKRYSPYPVHISQPMSETSQQNAPDTSIRTDSNMDINTGTPDGDSYKEIVVKSEIISDDNSSTSVVTSASSATELLPSSIHLTHTQVSNSETNEDSNNTDTYTPDNTVVDTAIKVEKEEDELVITGVEMAEQNYDNWGPAQSGYEGDTSYTTMPPDQSAYKQYPECQQMQQICQPSNKRFKSVSETDIDQLRFQSTDSPLRTRNSTKWAAKLLKVWMSENQSWTVSSFEDLAPPVLDLLLQQFYASLINKKGSNYSQSALKGIRSGLNRHLNAPPYSRLLNLMTDKDFRVSNQVLKGMMKVTKTEPKKSKELITLEDHRKLYESGVFNLNHPITLQNKVMYELFFHFGCYKTVEDLTSLKKTSFEIRTDSNERSYLTMTGSEADTSNCTANRRNESRMYAMPNDANCPLVSYQKLLSKLNPQCDRLIQRARRDFQSENTKVWFDSHPLGIHKLRGFMARMSEQANLSQRYTNFCIRKFQSSQAQNKYNTDTTNMWND